MRLTPPETSFALISEDFGNRPTGIGGDVVVEIDKPTVGALGQHSSNGRLAASHEADQHDVVQRRVSCR